MKFSYINILTRIKEAQIKARKERDRVTSSLLTTLLGEAQMPGKNSGNRDSTDTEVILVIKKFIKNAKEMLKLSQPGTEQEKITLIELDILEEYLPSQLSENELRDGINRIIIELIESNMGQVMKSLKDAHNGNYDGRLASGIVKELLN